MSALDRLVDEFVEQYDADLKFNIGSRTTWAGALRLTLTNPDNEPSRSVTFYTAGAGDPEDAAEALLKDARAWLAEGNVEPMPVPEWME